MYHIHFRKIKIFRDYEIAGRRLPCMRPGFNTRYPYGFPTTGGVIPEYKIRSKLYPGQPRTWKKPEHCWVWSKNQKKKKMNKKSACDNTLNCANMGATKIGYALYKLENSLN